MLHPKHLERRALRVWAPTASSLKNNRPSPPERASAGVVSTIAARARVAAPASAVALTFTVAPALACPRCSVGQEARRQVWQDDFFSHLVVAVLPFVIIGAICARVHALGRP